ncbi:SEL1-like repeat protein [Aestuariivirga sp.]|uniref:SEL1-like repeat protein n=1 Tax=Aestuariivirga sp. TaxID=2650926 RepID=UPI0039E5D88F
MAKIEINGESQAEIIPNAATADILFELGMMYCLGRDVAQDYVAAHKWLNLAAMKGSEDARAYRCELAREMTSAQVAEAQRQARAWLTMH